MELNKIYNENCLDTLAKMPDDFLDLTVTSPPYDGLRNYNGYSFPFEDIARQLYRVTKKGGVVVWNIGDATENGSETFTSFRQALFFKDVCGFNAHDTMIWHKSNPMPQVKQPRYSPAFEYMFVFSKGAPKTFNPIKVKCESAGVEYRNVKVSSRNDPTRRVLKTAKVVPDEKVAFNVWTMGHASRNYGHSAVFPEELPLRHIKSWTNKGDLVYDPFMGSGTTAAMALKLQRDFIGSEMSSEYCQIINDRLKSAMADKETFDKFFV